MRRLLPILVCIQQLLSADALAEGKPAYMFGETFGLSGQLVQAAMRNTSATDATEIASGFGGGLAVRGGLLFAHLNQTGGPDWAANLGIELSGFGVPVFGFSDIACGTRPCRGPTSSMLQGVMITASLGGRFSIPIFSPDEDWHALIVGLDYKPSYPGGSWLLASPRIQPLGFEVHATFANLSTHGSSWNIRISAGFLLIAGDHEVGYLERAATNKQSTIFTIGIGADRMPALPH